MSYHGSLERGATFAVTNPVEGSVGGMVKKVSKPICEIKTFADCTYAVDFPDGDEVDGEMLVTVSFHFKKKARLKHKLQSLMDSL